jgi:hypothetical protein
VSSSERLNTLPPLPGDTAADSNGSNSGSEEQAPETERSSDRVSMANVTSMFGQQSTNSKIPDDRLVVLDEELFYSVDERDRGR